LTSSEVWKDIDYLPRHQVSNLGRIRHKKKLNILKGSISNHGYVRVNIQVNNKQKSYRVHRIVADHFVSNEEGKPFVNHMDCDKKNNVSTNLEWVTNKENIIHARDNGKLKHVRGEVSNLCKFTDETVNNIRSLKDSGKTMTEVSRIFNCSRTYVSCLWSNKVRKT
jgi:hypothetical protein